MAHANPVYYVVTDSQFEPHTVLFLINHRNTKKMAEPPTKFWTPHLDNTVVQFRQRSVAETVASKLRYNNPRVLDENEAREAYRHNLNVIRNEELAYHAESPGWDAHKDY